MMAGGTERTEDVARAHRAFIARRLPTLTLLNTMTTTVWLVTLVVAGDVPARFAFATAAAQLAVLVPTAAACRRRPSAPWIVPLAVAAVTLVGLSWIALFAAAHSSGILLGFVLFVLYLGMAIGSAWGLGPQVALQAVVTLGWVAAWPSIDTRLTVAERVAVAGLGSLICLVVAEWAARAFRHAERRRREDAELAARIQASETLFRNLHEHARDYIWVADLRGRLTYVNPAVAELHARPASALLGMTIADLLTDHPENPPLEAWRPGVARVRAGERLPSMIVQVRSASGPRWMESVITPVRDAEGGVIGLHGSNRDVTERRAAEDALRTSLAELRASEEKLRRLAQRQVTVREEERKRLGFDLHDDVCQELVGVGILVEAVRRRLGPIPADAAADLQRISRYLTEVTEHVRVLARDLRPSLLLDLGLEDSLRSLAAGLTTPDTVVRASFSSTVPRLAEPTEVAVYRIAQEALTNAVRHAHARSVALALGADAHTVRLEIRDDGCGFEPHARHGATLGLVSMEERALALGGRLTIDSRPGGGTTVCLECPLETRTPESGAA